jgi:hypothetical protein
VRCAACVPERLLCPSLLFGAQSRLCSIHCRCTDDIGFGTGRTTTVAVSTNHSWRPYYQYHFGKKRSYLPVSRSPQLGMLHNIALVVTNEHMHRFISCSPRDGRYLHKHASTGAIASTNVPNKAELSCSVEELSLRRFSDKLPTGRTLPRAPC